MKWHPATGLQLFDDSESHHVGLTSPATIWHVLALWVLLAGDAKHRAAKDLQNGFVEFSQRRIVLSAWLWISVFLGYAATKLFLHSHDNPLNLAIATCPAVLAIAFLCSIPGTVIVSPETVQQIFWFRKTRRIQWEQIVEVNTGGKNQTVTITGADGTKIVHSNQLADRARLLCEIKKYCGEKLPSEFALIEMDGSPHPRF
ncbi:MAG TPA: hypothetical protein VFN53_11080 [Acidobacteriaceae bacterium]|nr:hypothetical protein [Acidobacteriaceae bacterium]